MSLTQIHAPIDSRAPVLSACAGAPCTPAVRDYSNVLPRRLPASRVHNWRKLLIHSATKTATEISSLFIVVIYVHAFKSEMTLNSNDV